LVNVIVSLSLISNTIISNTNISIVMIVKFSMSIITHWVSSKVNSIIYIIYFIQRLISK